MSNIPVDANIYVIAPTWLGYDQIVNVLKLDPSRCFHCLTEQEAVDTATIAVTRGVPIVFAKHQTFQQAGYVQSDWQHVGEVLYRIAGTWTDEARKP